MDQYVLCYRNLTLYILQVLQLSTSNWWWKRGGRHEHGYGTLDHDIAVVAGTVLPDPFYDISWIPVTIIPVFIGIQYDIQKVSCFVSTFLGLWGPKSHHHARHACFQILNSLLNFQHLVDVIF